MTFPTPEQLNEFARNVDKEINPGLAGDERTIGFIGIFFELKGGQFRYIANTGNPTIVAAAKELIKLAEAGGGPFSRLILPPGIKAN